MPYDENILNSIATPVAIFNAANMKHEFINEAYKREFGYSMNDVDHFDQKIAQFIHPDDQAIVANGFSRLLEKDYPQGTEISHRFRAADGRWLNLDVKINVLTRTDQGLPGLLVCTLIDKTEENRVQRFLEQGQETAQIGTGVIDLESRKVFWSAELYRILQVSEDLPVEDDSVFIQAFHPEDRSRVKTYLKESLRSRKVETLQARVQLVNGKTRYLRCFGWVECDHMGKPLKIIITCQNITPMVEQDLEKEKYHKYLEKALAMGNMGAWFYNLQNNEVWWSSQVYEIFGIDRKIKPTFDLFLSFLHEEDRQEIIKSIRKPINYKSIEQDYRIIINGSTRCLRDYHEPRCNKAGEVISLEGIIQDITDEKEKAIRLEKASRAKSDFLRHISHEFRTPLNGILGLSELMLEEKVSPDAAQYARLIRDSTRSLSFLIGQVLDLNRIEAGKVNSNITTVDIRQVLQEIENLFRPEIMKNKKLNFSVTLKAGSPEYYSTDQVILRQVLINLVGNASKFTRDGHIRVIVSDATEGFLQVMVEDTGAGMSPEDVARVFEPFFQVETREFRNEGLGLGLSIVYRLLKAIDGSIDIDSVPCQGTRVTVQLPAWPVDDTGRLVSNQGERVVKPRSVLIVEDTRVNSLVLERILDKLGHHHDLAQNGSEALEKSQKKRYDIIFMDLRLPDIDGIEVTRQIKQGQKNHETPVIALTADAIEEQRTACFNVGMVGFLPKPVDRKTIFNQFQRIFEEEDTASSIIA